MRMLWAKRRGFTLIEMMIAMIITLMMVFAMVEVFRRIGDATTDGRAIIEMLGQIRSARHRLESDLQACTVPLQPWTDSNSHPGYFELIEGIGSDTAPTQFIYGTSGLQNFVISPTDTLAVSSQSIFGDVDDVLMFTARNDLTPFRGRYNGGTTIIESNLAEIIWWSELNDVNGNGTWDAGETFVIRRRVLLIRPDLNDGTTGFVPGTMGATDVKSYLQNNDVSVHLTNDGMNNQLRANSLEELSLRQNRTAHLPIAPGSTTGLDVNGNMSAVDLRLLPAFAAGSELYGEDVVLTNVAAFDFRVWDPNAPITTDGGPGLEALTPGDPGYDAVLVGGAANVIGTGAFVDLGALTLSPALGMSTAYNDITPPAPQTNPYYGPLYDPQFLANMNPKSRLLGGNGYVYDPWTIAYEKDGYDQDSDGTIDQGTNGLDDDGVNGADDTAAERETSPPYPYPLRGIQVKIRMYEPDTRQVRQASHAMTFRND